jgi:hypothetical protein
MSKSKKNKAICLQTTEKLSLEELAERVSQIVEHDDASLFVAMFEKMYESWKVTEECIKHFKSLEVVYNKEFDDEDKDDLSPKSLL